MVAFTFWKATPSVTQLSGATELCGLLNTHFSWGVLIPVFGFWFSLIFAKKKKPRDHSALAPVTVPACASARC